MMAPTAMGNLLFWLGIGAAQKGAGSKPTERRHWVASLVVGILIAVLIAAGAFILLVSQKWSGAKGPSLASSNKSLA
jgi:cytoskeletal protein RodZ